MLPTEAACSPFRVLARYAIVQVRLREPGVDCYTYATAVMLPCDRLRDTTLGSAMLKNRLQQFACVQVHCGCLVFLPVALDITVCRSTQWYRARASQTMSRVGAVGSCHQAVLREGAGTFAPRCAPSLRRRVGHGLLLPAERCLTWLASGRQKQMEEVLVGVRSKRNVC